MNGGDDPRGLDLPFRQSGLNFIKTRLKDYYGRSSNDPTLLQRLDEIANNFEQKVFIDATSPGDYIKLIEQKFMQAVNMFPASSVSGNQLEGNVVSRPVVQSSSAELNFNQNPNIPVMKSRNMAVQNHELSHQNYPENESSSAYVRSQNYSGASALSSISGSGTANPDHIVQFLRAKFSYLPELEKWLKTLEGQFFEVQTVSECDSLKTHIDSAQQMIRMLSVAENQLGLLNKQKLRHNLNIVTEYYNKFVKNGITFAMKQAHQLSSVQRMACTNLTSPVPMNQPMISTSTISSGFSSGPGISTEPMDMRNITMTNLVTQIQSPETPQFLSQPEKRKHPLNSTLVPNTNNTYSKLSDNGKQSTNTTSRTPKKTCSKPREKSSGNSHESWLNLAALRSKRSSIPTNKLSQSSTPSTPMTQSYGKTAEIETVKETSNSQEQLILEDPVSILGAPEILSGSPMLSDSIGPEPTQQHFEDWPIDRLLEAVNLADIAYLDHDGHEPSFDFDLKDQFEESMDYNCMNGEDQQPFKRLKRDIKSESMDASFPPSNNSAVEQSFKLEPGINHIVMQPYKNLLDEIKDANQNLSGTVIEIVEESSNQSNGTIVRCTYSPCAGNADILRSMFASQSMNLSAEFLVPFEYPTSPPKILDCKPPDFGIAIEMTEMAKLMLASLVRSKCSSSVSEMAQVWDRCSQSAVLAYEKLFGAEISARKMVMGTLLDPNHDQLCKKTSTI